MSTEKLLTRAGFDLTHGWFPLRRTFLRTGTDRKVSFVLEPLVPTESS